MAKSRKERMIASFAGSVDFSVSENRKLRRTGNSQGVTLSRKELDIAGFSSEEPLQVQAEPGRVTITSASDEFEKTRAAGRAAFEQYRFAFEKLAE